MQKMMKYAQNKQEKLGNIENMANFEVCKMHKMKYLWLVLFKMFECL